MVYKLSVRTPNIFLSIEHGHFVSPHPLSYEGKAKSVVLFFFFPQK